MVSGLEVIGFDRGLMGLSLAVHIILASLAMALPLLMVLSEFIGIKRNDKDFTIFAKRISKPFLVFLGVGTASGILIAINILVLWPKFMSLVSQVAILPFNFETIAFFMESLFVAVYFFSWGKLKRKYTHVLLGIPVVIGGALSAVFITMINAFMNTPVGFNKALYLANGTISNINPWAVFTSPSAANEILHVVGTTYFMGISIVLGYLAIRFLKTKNQKEKTYYKKIIWMLLILAAIFIVWSVITGMTSASSVYAQQPEKFAAIEGDLHPMTYAPEIIGGFPGANGTLKDYFKIPDLQSILAAGKPSGAVPGLSQYNPDTYPPLFIHFMFDFMVIVGTGIAFILLLIIFLRIIKKNPLSRKITSISLVVSGIFSILLVENGWIMAESGRQPWIIYNIMRVSQAANPSPSVIPVAIAIAAFYIFIIPLSIFILKLIFRNKPLDKDLKSRAK